MMEPTNQEMIEGVRKAVYDALTDQRDISYMPKRVVLEAVVRGVKEAFESRTMSVAIQIAVKDGVAEGVRRYMAENPSAIQRMVSSAAVGQGGVR